MRYLEAIVDVQARHHHQETVRVDTAHECFDDVRIPRLVSVVHQAVDRVGSQERHGHDVKIAEGNLVVFFGLLLRLGQFVLVLEHNHVGQEREWGVSWRWAHTHVNRLGDLPGL